MTTPHVIAPPSQRHLRTATLNDIVGGRFRVGKKIGEGSFGVVFEATDLFTTQPVAVKFEPRKSDVPRLRDEVRSYRTLNGTAGVPKVHHFGQEGLHNCLVIDLLGPSLEDLFDMCDRKFTIKTITRIQSVHDESLIYGDIKPDDFLVGVPGTKTANTIHIIDFGTARHYRDPKTKIHIPYRERKSPSALFSTPRYMSTNSHLGREQSRRDDLESLGHVFMYFLRGSLPWQGLKAETNRQRYEKIAEKKQTTPIDELCKGFPEEFAVYMNYVRKLGFEESPDYDFLRELFTKVLKNIGEQDDSIFDWMLINNGKDWEAGNTPAQSLENGVARVAGLNELLNPNDKLLLHDATRRPSDRRRNPYQLPAGFFNDSMHHPHPSRRRNPSPSSARPPTRSRFLEWTRGSFFNSPNRQNDEGIGLQKRSPAVVNVPLAQSNFRNYSAREVRMKKEKAKDALAGSSRPNSPNNVAQQSDGAAQAQSSSELHAAVSTLSTTAAIAATSVFTMRWTRFWSAVCCISTQDADGHH